MRRKLFIIATLLAAVPSVLWAQPTVVFSNPTVDLGDVLWKTPVKAHFPFANGGDAPLHIEHIEADCGCLEPQWRAAEIAPQACDTITVVFDAKLLGHFTRHIWLFTNASATPFGLTLQGVVRATLPDLPQVEEIAAPIEEQTPTPNANKKRRSYRKEKKSKKNLAE